MENFTFQSSQVEVDDGDLSNHPKKLFSRVGFILTFLVIAVQFVQTIISIIANQINPEWVNQAFAPWLLVIGGYYLTAFPAYCFLMKRIPDTKDRETKSFSISKMVVLFIISMATTYLFNLISTVINYLIQVISGGTVQSSLSKAIGSSNLLYTFLCVCILAPIVEEITFRGILIRKLKRYGDKTAIWISAFAFGLFHLNFSQFFYATALGVIFGYVVVRTNRIRYSIILHMCVNAFGSIILPSLVNSKNTIGVVTGGYLVLFFFVAGVILFQKERKYIQLQEGSIEVKKDERKKVIYGNLGMMLYFLLCGVLFILNTISTIV